MRAMPLYLFRSWSIQGQWRAAEFSGDKAPDGLVQAHDDALAVEAGDRAGVAVQVQRPGAVVDAHPVADLQTGSGDERLGGGQQLLALGDGGGQHGQLGVQLARPDALDQRLDVGGGVRLAGWRRGGWWHRGEGTPGA